MCNISLNRFPVLLRLVIISENMLSRSEATEAKGKEQNMIPTSLINMLNLSEWKVVELKKKRPQIGC